MQPTGTLLITERIRDIERESAADVQRFEVGSRPSRPAWRRHAGAAAHRLGIALEDLAAELDPVVGRPSYGRE